MIKVHKVVQYWFLVDGKRYSIQFHRVEPRWLHRVLICNAKNEVVKNDWLDEQGGKFLPSAKAAQWYAEKHFDPKFQG